MFGLIWYGLMPKTCLRYFHVILVCIWSSNFEWDSQNDVPFYYYKCHQLLANNVAISWKCRIVKQSQHTATFNRYILKFRIEKSEVFFKWIGIKKKNAKSHMHANSLRCLPELELSCHRPFVYFKINWKLDPFALKIELKANALAERVNSHTHTPAWMCKGPMTQQNFAV